MRTTRGLGDFQFEDKCLGKVDRPPPPPASLLLLVDCAADGVVVVLHGGAVPGQGAAGHGVAGVAPLGLSLVRRCEVSEVWRVSHLVYL